MDWGPVSGESLSVHMAGGDYLTSVGLGQLFEAAGFIGVSGLSTCGDEALDRVRAEAPDVVLMDALISHHGMAETTASICRLKNPPKVVILAADGAHEPMENAFRAGACSYLVRGATLEDIAAALRIVHRGGLVNSVQPAWVHRSEPQELAATEARARFRSLSARDLQIVEALADGHTNAQISRQLHLSEATVKARLAQLMQQWGMDNRVQVAVAAVKAGLGTSDRELIS